MRKYWVEYGNKNGETGEITKIATSVISAYDVEHALDKFWSNNDDWGFTPIRIALAPRDRASSPKWESLV